ncbi:metallophosphoesterase [candidate division WOR-3 bacterium]|nr:metallophosphoesterase [candidate division WOR-3 bacterium]
MIIYHISDLHLGSSYYLDKLGASVANIINNDDCDILLVTGDLTSEGHYFEFQAVKKYLKTIKSKEKLIIPGNHDSRNAGYITFENVIGKRNTFIITGNIAILGLDSSEPDLDDGHIGRENYPMIRKFFEDNDDKIKILSLHHHLIPIPKTGRERHIPVDAGDVLELIKELNIHMVISGHKHVPYIWKLENTYFITAGTATTNRTRGDQAQSFNKIIIRNRNVRVSFINSNTGNEKEVLNFNAK